MKILFTADMHLKLGQKNVPVEWAKNRYRQLFKELAILQKDCDIFIVGGDTFDKVPSIEELELFFMFVNSCTIPTIIYSGNHEALKKNTTFLSNLKSIVSAVNDKVQIIDDFVTLYGIDFIPYNKLKEYHPADIDFHSDILCTHVRGEIPPHVKPEVNLSIFDRWKVVLAGDLHSHDNCQRNIIYPGSPVTTSFHRNIVDAGVIILDSESLEYKWIKLELPQLIRKTVKAGDPMPATEFHHTIYEVEGDLAELGAVQDNGLLDKKVVKRDIDTALILSPEMTLQQEVTEYLKYIIQLDEKTVDSVLLELSNHASKII
jgi:DNA repair exonuclease SbcCD nuclease subunit